ENPDWNAYATEIQVQRFKHGRSGNDEVRIIQFSPDQHGKIEECGDKHKFNGKWYYCIKLACDSIIQVGWGTEKFVPNIEQNLGVGDNDYSWSYDGSRGTLYHNATDYFASSVRWTYDDVCGCGIEIDGENTVIKYWLNGELLGTAFTHKTNPDCECQCNLLPDGEHTIYYPAASLSQGSCCEFIFSPEDMEKCPLPKGYKPLLLPKIIHTENTLVAYPYSAYLVGDKPKDYFHINREQSEVTHQFLRDFVNKEHIQTTSKLEDVNKENYQQLKVPNMGIPFSIDTYVNNETLTALTISFDFEYTVIPEVNVDEFIVKLLTLDTELFTIPIQLNKSTEANELKFQNKNIYHIAIIFQLQKPVIIYINNKCSTFDCNTFNMNKKNLNFCILPEFSGEIKNIGIWRYALSEQHIKRLFIYSLFYVFLDYQKLRQHRKQTNTFMFKRPQFPRELLLFTEPFDSNLWDKKKKSIDANEFKYFKMLSTDTVTNIEYGIQLFGNNSYLVLDKSQVDAPVDVNEKTETTSEDSSAGIWTEYTIIMDISIPYLPVGAKTVLDNDIKDVSTNDTAITRNVLVSSTDSSSSVHVADSNESEAILGMLTLLRISEHHAISITNKGRLRVGNTESETTLKLNEYLRLVICKKDNNIKVYVNGKLELNGPIDEDTYELKEPYIYLFKETDNSNITAT
ncbi:unnamed protein product, partial [Didymodactylos carnosus]